MITRFFKYGVVKIIGAIVYLSLLYLFVDIFGLGKMAAQYIMVVFSFFTKFYLNNYVTWGDRREKSKKELVRRMALYALIGVFVSALNILIYYLLIESNIHYLIAAIISGGVGSVIGFLLCNRYVWKKEDGKEFI